MMKKTVIFAVSQFRSCLKYIPLRWHKPKVAFISSEQGGILSHLAVDVLQHLFQFGSSGFSW